MIHHCLLHVKACLLEPLILLVVACGGAVSSTASDASPSATPVKTSKQVQTLKASGQLPKLDRSADIRGPDNDNNGIRDDIDAWIAAQPITDGQKKAASQMARVQQAKLLVDVNDRDALQALGDQSMAGVSCLVDVFKPNNPAGYDLIDQIEAMTANTKARAQRYIAYNRARSGSVTELPSGNACKQ